MAVLQYLQPIDGLPQTKGLLTSELLSATSAERIFHDCSAVLSQAKVQCSVCTTAVLLQLLLPIPPGKHGIPASTVSSHALLPSLQVHGVN